MTGIMYDKMMRKLRQGGNEITTEDQSNLTNEQRIQALANISDQTANANTGKMGYKVLLPGKSFAEQVTEANTIYEIRYVFSSIGSSGNPYSLPNGCVIYLNGGGITNSFIEGNVDVISEDYSKIKGVFLDGYNIAGRDSVESCNIGLVENDSNYASFNNRILQNVINHCKTLTLSSKYYITGTRTVSSSFTIQGGSIVFTGRYTDVYFEPLVNSEIIFRGVEIIGVEHELVKTTNNLNYVIKRIEFDNCIVHGTRPVYLRGADILYDTTNYGLEFFIVKDCKFIDSERSLFILGDCVVSKQFHVKGNYINKAVGVSFSCGTTNEYQQGGFRNKKNQCDFVVENNTFIGGYSNNSSYYCPCLFEVNKVYFKNNIVKNYIMGGTGVAYDNYVSSNEYYFEGNHVTNVCNLPASGTPNDTPSEIFKSKGVGIVRYAHNNTWEINFDECRDILENEYNTTFTDEEFEAISTISIFIFNSPQESLSFVSNTVTIKGGMLTMNTSAKPVKNAEINNNRFEVEHCSGVLLPFWNEAARNYSFCRNTIVNGDDVFNVFNAPASTTGSEYNSIVMTGNVSNCFISVPTQCKEVCFLDNIVMGATISSNTFFYTPTNKNSKIEVCGFNLLSAQKYLIIQSANYKGLFSFNGWAAYGQGLRINYSNKIIVRIPYYDFRFYLEFAKISDTSWQIKDEYGSVIGSGDFSESTEYTTMTFDKMFFRYNVSSNKCMYLQIGKRSGSSVDYELLPFSVEFVDVYTGLDSNNAGKTRYNNGQLEVWNGTNWVNPDGTPLSSRTITNTLASVTNSNPATSIDCNRTYMATLTPGLDYVIQSVTVTMGGTDVTSFVYNPTTHVIYIASVTGDIVITATAGTPN